MSRIKIGFFLLFCLFTSSLRADVTQWVDPFIGTGKTGNTFPGALVPWGMVSVSPHNNLQAPSGYKQGEPYIYGFGQVHLSGTDCPDLGSLLVMPTVGPIRLELENRRSQYDSETATPGYYRVNLKTSGILAEMTATTRVGVSQFSFPARKGDANILIDVSRRLTNEPATVKSSFESHVKIISNNEVEGSAQSGDFCTAYSNNKQTVYFVARFSKPAVSAGTWKDSVPGGDNGKRHRGHAERVEQIRRRLENQPIIVPACLSGARRARALRRVSAGVGLPVPRFGHEEAPRGPSKKTRVGTST